MRLCVCFGDGRCINLSQDTGNLITLMTRPQPFGGRRRFFAKAPRRFGYRPFDRAVWKDLIGWLTPAAQVARAAEPLIEMMIGELRRRQILSPAWMRRTLAWLSTSC